MSKKDIVAAFQDPSWYLCVCVIPPPRQEGDLVTHLYEQNKAQNDGMSLPRPGYIKTMTSIWAPALFLLPSGKPAARLPVTLWRAPYGKELTPLACSKRGLEAWQQPHEELGNTFSPSRVLG